MNESIVIPVLLIGFNRPHCIRKVMQQLAIVKPKVLYVSIDAPRDNRPDDNLLVEEVKTLVKNVNWPCETHYRFHDKNVGAEINVSGSISWVLESHEMVIVNEDDIYAPYSFYKFMQDMLFLYKDDEQIAMVSGINHSVMPDSPPNDYYFTKMGHIWGWGTWKRVWDKYDLNEYVDVDSLSEECLYDACANKQIAQIESSEFKVLLKPENRTWDYMFYYFRLINGYLSIVPTRNLVSNIGIDGLHTNIISLSHFYSTDENFRALPIKKSIKWNKEYDIYHFYAYLNPGKFRRFCNRVKLYFMKRVKYNKRYIDLFFNS